MIYVCAHSISWCTDNFLHMRDECYLRIVLVQDLKLGAQHKILTF